MGNDAIVGRVLAQLSAPGVLQDGSTVAKAFWRFRRICDGDSPILTHQYFPSVNRKDGTDLRWQRFDPDLKRRSTV